MPVCCSRDDADPPSMNTSAANTPAAGCQRHRRAKPSTPTPPTKRWAAITASKVAMLACGARSANSTMEGVNTSDCGSATAG